MKETFGILPSGEAASLYTISCGGLTAAVTDYGANLVRLLVPDKNGVTADVVLGCDDCNGYRVTNGAALGATVGRNSNRLKGASFRLGDTDYFLPKNEGNNNLHSGPDFFFQRMWKLVEHTPASVTLELNSPDGDQGFPATPPSVSPTLWMTAAGCTSAMTPSATRIPCLTSPTTATSTWQATSIRTRPWSSC